MIEIFIEKTGKVGEFIYQEHKYFLDKKTGKLVAFQPAPEYTEVKVFEKPLTFSKRFRKLKKIGEVENL